VTQLLELIIGAEGSGAHNAIEHMIFVDHVQERTTSKHIQLRDVGCRSCLTSQSVMKAQWENEHISMSVLPVAWVQVATVAGYFKGFFPG